MNRTVRNGALALMVVITTVAAQAQQTTTDTTRQSNEPILRDSTRQEIREAGKEVKEAAKEVGRDVERAADKVGQEVKQSTRAARREARETIDRIRANELDWFQRGSFLLGLNLGLGLGTGSYLISNPRVAYFVQRGIAVGVKLSVENRLSTSYRANQGGGFIRYYPVRNRFFVFGEGGFNIGRYRTSIVGPDDKRGFSSVNLGLGVGLQATRNVGLELMYDHNYYDKTPEFAGRNRGPQIKFGVNLHLRGRE